MRPIAPSAPGRYPSTTTSASRTRAQEAVPGVGAAKVEETGVLAGARVDDQQVDLRQVGPVDLQHVGTVGGQEATSDRAGDDPGEIEDPNSRQRTVSSGLRDLRLRPADRLDVEVGQGVEGLTVGVGQPLGGGPLHRGAHAGGSQHVLQRGGLPCRHGRLDRIPFRLVQAEDGQRSGLVMREVGVDLEPPVVTRCDRCRRSGPHGEAGGRPSSRRWRSERKATAASRRSTVTAWSRSVRSRSKAATAEVAAPIDCAASSVTR